MTGTVFSIEEFSVYDGPGIRTTVFLKGCPMRCEWCHNPEGQYREPEIIRSPNGCINCGNCIRNSYTENGRVFFKEESILKCPKNLLRVCGDKFEAKELCETVLKNKMLLTDGGVTFSGGEPLYQDEFLLECLTILKGKLHTAVQTSGFAKKEVFERVLNLADYFLFDLKLIDEEDHIKYTGVSNSRILENYSLLAKSGTEFVTRVPLIPGVTDTEGNIAKIAEFMKENSVSYCELLSYNKMAGSKYKMLMREYKPTFDESIPVNSREEIFREYGINVKVM